MPESCNLIPFSYDIRRRWRLGRSQHDTSRASCASRASISLYLIFKLVVNLHVKPWPESVHRVILDPTHGAKGRSSTKNSPSLLLQAALEARPESALHLQGVNRVHQKQPSCLLRARSHCWVTAGCLLHLSESTLRAVITRCSTEFC